MTAWAYWGFGTQEAGDQQPGTHGPWGGPASHSCLALVWVSQWNWASGCHPRPRLLSLSHAQGSLGTVHSHPLLPALALGSDPCSPLLLPSVSPALESWGMGKWRARVEAGARDGSCWFPRHQRTVVGISDNSTSRCDENWPSETERRMKPVITNEGSVNIGAIVALLGWTLCQAPHMESWHCFVTNSPEGDTHNTGKTQTHWGSRVLRRTSLTLECHVSFTLPCCQKNIPDLFIPHFTVIWEGRVCFSPVASHPHPSLAETVNDGCV